MVDALGEAARVVSIGGRVLDLRPLAIDVPFEVVSSESAIELAVVDGAPGLAADLACARAEKEAIAAGWLVRERVDYFTFALYWDSVAELRSFLAEHWRSRRRPPAESSVEAAGRLLGSLGGSPRIRVREVLRLARFRRLPVEGSTGPAPRDAAPAPSGGSVRAAIRLSV